MTGAERRLYTGGGRPPLPGGRGQEERRAGTGQRLPFRDPREGTGSGLADGGGLGPVQNLAGVLRGFHCLTDPDARTLFLGLLARELGAGLPLHLHRVTDYFLLELAQKCLTDPGLLSPLRRTLMVMDESPGSVGALDEVMWQLTAEPMLPGSATGELRDLLDGLEVPQLTAICRIAAGPLHEVPPLADVWEAFTVLSRMNAQPGGLPPVLVLVEYLAAEAPYKEADALRAWADRQAHELSLTAQQRELRQQVVHAAVPEPAEAYLVVQLLPQDEPGRFLLSSWRHCAPGSWSPALGRRVPVTWESAERVVQELVYEAAEEWAQDADCLHLEFLLGPDELNIPVHLWRQELDSDHATPLCMDYPVVVRSLERSQTRRWHRGWRQRWNFFQARPQEARSAVIDSGEPGGPTSGDATTLEARLKADSTVAALVLSSPPDTRGNGNDQARAAWRAGVPIVLWDRRPDRSPELAQLNGRLVQLRETVKQLRLHAQSIDSAEREHHLGSHVMLVWDDPTRPVEVERRLAGPDQEVGGS